MFMVQPPCSQLSGCLGCMVGGLRIPGGGMIESQTPPYGKKERNQHTHVFPINYHSIGLATLTSEFWFIGFNASATARVISRR